jgi:murein L,D-transpeptidase YcbB/YkuD
MLYVNIPAYRLKIYESNAVKDTYRVIVGNPKTPTPLLTGNMERIIANPMWYVPRKIAVNEILPKLKSDSTYLARNGFKVLDKNHNVINAADIDMNNIKEQDFNYTFRQNRGTDNSLGLVKFIFSNPYAVYLHDTPGKSLFSKDLRAFSHGCVRVQNPEKLAHYILQRFNSDTTDFAALMQTGRHREFTIQASLPIKITYITCEGDDNGHVYFYKDIYERDEKELELLAKFMGI